MKIFDKPVKVGKSDVYTVTVDDEWLDGQTLNSANITSGDVNVATVEPATISGGNVISVRTTGVAAGFVELDVEFAVDNPIRTDCHKLGLNVVDC